MYIIIGVEDKASYCPGSFLTGEDIGENDCLFFTNAKNKEEALKEFEKHLFDNNYNEDENLGDNMVAYEQFDEICILNVRSVERLLVEKWQKKIKLKISLKLLAIDEEEEEELYLKLKEKYER